MYRITNNFVSIYKRLVYIGAEQFSAYIDTGSKLNILTQSKAELLNLSVASSDVVIRGFGGAYTQSLGRSQINVIIDGVCLSGYIEITNCNLIDIELTIGQPMINQPGISLITTSASANFVETSEIFDNLMCIKLDDADYNSKYKLYLKSDVNVPD